MTIKPRGFPNIYDLYDEDTLFEEHKEHCLNDRDYRIFFQGPVNLIKQEWNGAIYKLANDEVETIIKVPNMTHLRLAHYPYPEIFDIIAPVYDKKMIRTKKVVNIITGMIPKNYIFGAHVGYYLELRRTFG